MQPESSRRETAICRAAIKPVTDNWKAKPGEMHSNLMAASGSRHYRQQRRNAKASQWCGARECFPSRFRRDHLARIFGVMRYPLLDLNRMIELALDERQVFTPYPSASNRAAHHR